MVDRVEEHSYDQGELIADGHRKVARLSDQVSMQRRLARRIRDRAVGADDDSKAYGHGVRTALTDEGHAERNAQVQIDLYAASADARSNAKQNAGTETEPQRTTPHERYDISYLSQGLDNLSGPELRQRLGAIDDKLRQVDQRVAYLEEVDADAISHGGARQESARSAIAARDSLRTTDHHARDEIGEAATDYLNAMKQDTALRNNFAQAYAEYKQLISETGKTMVFAASAHGAVHKGARGASDADLKRYVTTVTTVPPHYTEKANGRHAGTPSLQPIYQQAVFTRAAEIHAMETEDTVDMAARMSRYSAESTARVAELDAHPYGANLSAEASGRGVGMTMDRSLTFDTVSPVHSNG